ncbi:site-specific integrase, partial [Nocardia sp. NPDC004260]
MQRRPRENGRHFARRRFPARLAASTWPATEARRETVLAQLTSPPFTLESRNQKRRDAGLRLLLTWLEEQNGQTWQERWLATGADTAGFSWRQITERWLRERGELTRIRHQAMSAALSVAICADVIRPSITWFAAAGSARGLLAAMIEQCRDPEGFGQLRAIVTADPGTSSALATYALYRCASIVASKGGCLSDIVIGDLLELLDAEHNTHRRRSAGQSGLYRALHGMGIFGDDAPQTFRELRTIGQRTPEELIDRYGIVCQPIRDLLVDYLRERQPALDYNSLESLSQHLGRNFWANIEQLHPGIDTLHLPADVAQQWKQRLRTLPKTITTETGEKRSVVVPRINYRECLTPVRAFYLDLAHWAIENPARWSRWVVPCPVGAEEINRRKDKRQRKSRMDARTRERLPVLPLLVSTTQQRHKDAQALLEAATRARPGKPFSAAGQHLIRSIVAAPGQGKIWAHDPITGKRRNLALEEEHAFWTFAVVEVLRHTGIRVEELLEISHHSLVQYRLPTTGELVPLLQIAPSKTDTERLLVVSPELADILSTVISRIRTASGSVPLVPAFDRYEAIWMPPAPLLFQRRVNGEHRAINDHAVRQMLRHALADTGLVDSLTGQPLHYTP